MVKLNYNELKKSYEKGETNNELRININSFTTRDKQLSK